MSCFRPCLTAKDTVKIVRIKQQALGGSVLELSRLISLIAV